MEIMKNKKELMTIGELSSRAGVTRRTIHFYIQEGLLPEPERPHKNIAYYDEEFIEMIAAIKKAQTERFLPRAHFKKVGHPLVKKANEKERFFSKFHCPAL